MSIPVPAYELLQVKGETILWLKGTGCECRSDTCLLKFLPFFFYQKEAGWILPDQIWLGFAGCPFYLGLWARCHWPKHPSRWYTALRGEKHTGGLCFSETFVLCCQEVTAPSRTCSKVLMLLECSLVCQISDLLCFLHHTPTLASKLPVTFQVLVFGPMSSKLATNWSAFQDYQNMDSLNLQL